MLLKALAKLAVLGVVLSSASPVFGQSSVSSASTQSASSPVSVQPQPSGSCRPPTSTTNPGGSPSINPSQPATTGGGNSSASGSHWVLYHDSANKTLATADLIKGFNVYLLAFFTIGQGVADQAKAFADLDENKRKQMKSDFNAAGIKLMVSAFGSTDTPTTSGHDAVQIANTVAAFVKKYELDGIDVDYEDLNAFNKGDGSAEEWLITFTKTLRSQLPQGQYIITHAPLPPWFGIDSSGKPLYGGGGYIKVDKEVGNMIDWYNLQFYNQKDYLDCQTLITQSGFNPKTSLFEIAAAGIPMHKLVIGKPATAADATNGDMDPATLATCLQQAKEKNWSAGAMVWQYPNADAAWIKTVRSKSWPVA